MIWVTRLDGTQLLLNDDRVNYVEVQGDTVITLSNGDKLRVLESVGQLTDRIVQWRRKLAGVEGLVSTVLGDPE